MRGIIVGATWSAYKAGIVERWEGRRNVHVTVVAPAPVLGGTVGA